jgi:hypothetical protein
VVVEQRHRFHSVLIWVWVAVLALIYPLEFHREWLRVCLRDYLALGDNNRISAGQGRFNPKWRRLFRDTSRRWRMFRLSDKAISIHRHTFRCSDAVRNDLLRPHLFGVIG